MTYLLNALTIIYIFMSFIIKAAISVFYLLFKLDLTSDKVLLPVYMICLVVDLAMIVTQTIFFNVNGFRVMKVIGERQKSKSSKNGKDNKSHYVKIMVLQSALTFCALFQILAIIFEPLTRQTGIMVWGPLRDFVNSFGILSFAIVVLFLYNPVLVEKVSKSSNNKVKNGKTMGSMSYNESTRSTHSDSETTHNHSHQSSQKQPTTSNFLTVDYHYKDSMSVGSSSSFTHNDEGSSTISVVEIGSSQEDQFSIELQSKPVIINVEQTNL
ncbi:predicted protein [Naegleria gruberi]|uniref:Predicted protein n=1 Tax=Naegleria gruberi TaxID=5762 RepID=D2VFT4_NAEGR|nr:uncharacterized protein NAEGRDRAFT_67736 [Naegleria gruberi]EFC44245.1 predicted protein [Naegleria gruberi]|eukprot:XP_002676989.1 predicted protein [Naegleria gruberi strain NEG-M]